jgi:hypothetical protein
VPLQDPQDDIKCQSESS